MGALPGRGLLNERSPGSSGGASPPAEWFDVERWRTRVERTVAVRRPTTSILVLGSSQSDAVVDQDRARRAGTSVLRRRSGGGAVLVGPEDPLWFDLWLPRGDPLWEDDVVAGSFWVGEWWAEALRAIGIDEPTVRRGPSIPAPWSGLVCFAGLGPGEVSVDGRKVVGVSQWRSRQGALFQSCAYGHWDGAAVAGLLEATEAERAAMENDLQRGAVGLSHVARASDAELRSALLAGLPPGPPWRVLSS